MTDPTSENTAQPDEQPRRPVVPPEVEVYAANDGAVILFPTKEKYW